MPKKQNGADTLMKYLPAGVLAVSFVAGFVTLKNDVSAHADQLKELKVNQEKVSNDTTSIQVSQAQIKAQVENTYEAIKDIKEAIKGLKK